MNSKKSGIYFSQAFKSFISFLLIFSMVITPGLLPTVSKAEEKEETEVAENQKPDYLTAADLYQRYIDVTGQTTDVIGNNQKYKFDYSKDAPTYGQLSDVKFTQVASGYLGGYALDENGKVWSWGWNTHGRAGIGKTVGQQAYLGGMMQIPYFVENKITVTKIAAGYHTGYALDSEGQVYAWGHGTEGQMGNGKTDPINISPVKVEIPVKVKDFNVSNGEAIHHAAAIDENGELWLWGAFAENRIPGITSNAKTPINFKIPEGVTFDKVVPSYTATIALDTEGNVWSMGNAWGGQLGNDSVVNIRNKFEKVEGLPSVTDISTSYAHIMALTEDGKVYQWGKVATDLGTLSDTTKPVEVKISSEEKAYVGYTPIPQKIAAGEWVSYFIDQKGRTWSWGSGRYFGFAREGAYEDSNNQVSKEAVLYPRIIGDGNTSDQNYLAKFPRYATNNDKDKELNLTYLTAGINPANPTAYDEKYMLKDDKGNVLDNDGNQLVYQKYADLVSGRKAGYYYIKDKDGNITKDKGMPAIDPNETWINLTFQQPSYMESIASGRSETVFLDANGNIFKTSNDGSGSIAWGWDHDKYDSTGNAKGGLYDKYMYELVFMRGLPMPEIQKSKIAYTFDKEGNEVEVPEEGATVKAGDAIKYVIKAKNPGGKDKVVKIEDTLPEALSYTKVEIETTPELLAHTIKPVEGNKIEGEITLKAGQEIVITITGNVAEDAKVGTSLKNTVKINGNDVSTPEIDVDRAKTAYIGKEVEGQEPEYTEVKEDTTVEAGSLIKYVIEAKNTAKVDEAEVDEEGNPVNKDKVVKIEDTLPEALSYTKVEIETTPELLEHTIKPVEGNKIEGEITLKPGESVKITITGNVAEDAKVGTSLKNTVNIDGEDITTPEIEVEGLEKSKTAYTFDKDGKEVVVP